MSCFLRITRCLAAVLLWQVGSAGILLAQSDGVELKWRFEEGQKLTLEMEQSMLLKVHVAGNDVENENVTRTWMTWECGGQNDDGNYSIASTIDRMTMDVKGAMGNAQLDTDNEEDEGQAATIGQSVRPLIGVTMKHEMNSRGEVLKVDIPEKMVARFGQAGGPGMGNMLKDMSKQAALAFPAKPLRVGDSWTIDSNSASPAGKIAINKTYTYKGIVKKESREFHHFDVDVKMEFLEAPGGATIEIVDQSTKGNIYFDAAAGRVDHSEVEQLAKFKVTVGVQSMEQQLTQTVGMKIKEAKPATAGK